MEYRENQSEIEDFRAGLMQVSLDDSMNVVTEWEQKAKSVGISPDVRAYLKERLLSCMIDAGKSTEMSQLLRFHGRIAELRELLGLFKV